MPMPMNLAAMYDLEHKVLLQLAIELHEYREKTLENCKTQEEKDKWLDRWAIGDAAEKVADAVRSANRFPRSRFLGIF